MLYMSRSVCQANVTKNFHIAPLKATLEGRAGGFRLRWTMVSGGQPIQISAAAENGVQTGTALGRSDKVRLFNWRTMVDLSTDVTEQNRLKDARYAASRPLVDESWMLRTWPWTASISFQISLPE